MSKPNKGGKKNAKDSLPPVNKNQLGEEYLKAPDTPDPTEEEGAYAIEFRHELLDHFLEKADELGKAHDDHTSQAVNRIEEYEKIQEEHKVLYDTNHNNQDERRKLTEKLIEHSKNFEDYSKDSATHKRRLRAELDELEDTLRKLKDQISEMEIENKNLVLISETEQSIQDAKNRAEADAVNAVNRDLKELVARLSIDAEKDISFQEVSERIKGDVNKNYQQSENDFNRFLKQAETAREELSEDLNELKERAGNRNNDNEELRSRIEEGEVEIDRLNRSIDLLNKEIDNIKRTNEDSLKNLEADRQANEDTIADLRKTADDLKVEQSKLEISISKINSQLQYLSEAAKSGGNELIKQKINKFDKSIKSTEQKTEQLKSQLNGMNQEWNDKAEGASREMATLIRDSESKAAADKINQLLHELETRQNEINELKKKRSQIERELASSDPERTDRDIQNSSAELAAINNELLELLREKNNLYGELIQYTKELYDLNQVLQKNEQEIAKLKLELEWLRKEQEEKRFVYEHLKAQIEERRRILDDIKAEIARQDEIAKELQATLQARRDEGDELDKLLAERDSEIRKLEAQLEELNRNRPVEVQEPEPEPEPLQVEKPEARYVADEKDEVDRLLAQFINFNTCPVPIKRLGGGYYLFGTRKIYAKIMNGRLVIRVGGGYMVIDEFIATYAEIEVQKMRAREEKGLSAVPTIEDLSPSNRSLGSPSNLNKSKRKKSGSRSPASPGGTFKTSGSPINGTSRTKQFTQEQIDKLKSSGGARVVGSPK